MAQRHTFNEAELERYYDRISISKPERVYDVSTLSDDNKLSYLNLLQKHQLVKVPWENLTQHYSWHKVVNVKPAHLFRKMVDHPGRGGYCMEVNRLFHHILLSLKFNVYMAGARIHSSGGHYGGWTHVVNIITIDEKKYMVDGGFGPQGPSRPIRLLHDEETTQISPAQMRLLHEPIADNLDQSQKLWIYQYRYDENSSWAPMYCFVDFEFTPADIEAMNFAPWLSKSSFFTHKVVAVRFTTASEVDDEPGSATEEALRGEIDGSVTINQEVLKWRRGGEKAVEIRFESDEQRVEALEKFFGIVLTDEDREAIVGTAAMVGGKAMGADD